MSFLNPFFLVGLAAAALPIVIHLLTRDRIQRVAFSTLRFFAKVSKKVLRRRKFQEMILLALRMLLCVLLAIAFARPFLKGEQADPAGLTKADTARVLVVDVSASMARAGIAQAIQKEAADALRGLSEGSDAAALITFDDTPDVAVALTKNISQVAEKLKSVKPTAGGTDLAGAINRADGLLRQWEARQKEIVVVSDFQETGWQKFKGDWKLAPAVRIVPRLLKADAGPRQGGNVAIIQAVCPSGIPLDRSSRPIAARIANFSGGDISDLEVTLTVSDKKVAARKVSIKAGGTADVGFLHVFDTPGDNPGTITLGPEEGVPGDSIAADNVHYFNARVIPQIKVVLLNGSPSSMPLLDGAVFLRLAIAPPGADTPFAVRVVSAASARAEDLQDAQVVVLANVAEVSPAVRGALEALLGRGGGLFFLPGSLPSGQSAADPSRQPDLFNRVFDGLAPCKLRRVITPQPATSVQDASLAKVEFEHLIFEEFAPRNHGDLTTAKFTRYWEVGDFVSLAEGVEPGAGGAKVSRVLARFDDGRPAVLERQVGSAGVSVMLVSPAELGWNNFALRSTFAPYIHQTLRYLAVRSEPATAFTVGSALPAAADRKVLYRAAIKGVEDRTVDGKDLLAREAGFYSQLSPDGKAEFVWAVNRPPSESDPAVMPVEKLVAAVQGTTEQIAVQTASMAGGDEEGKRDESNIWWYLIASMGVLLLAELLLGNKTLRH